jgi:hypothetical protein
METFDQSDSGYPEEGPPGADPGTSSGDSEVRERSQEKAEEQSGATDNDDGKATGNPNTD